MFRTSWRDEYIIIIRLQECYLVLYSETSEKCKAGCERFEIVEQEYSSSIVLDYTLRTLSRTYNMIRFDYRCSRIFYSKQLFSN